MATYCSNSIDRALVGSLQRKMSLSQEFDDNNNGTRKQDEVKNEYGPMTDVLLVKNFKTEQLLP
jgi:hypothetical protein